MHPIFNHPIMNAVPNDIRALQQSIRREKIQRARRMTEDERLVATLDQIEIAFAWMLDGVKQQFPGITDTEATDILSRRLDRIRRREDRGLFIPVTEAA